jgi:hypothetical protein
MYIFSVSDIFHNSSIVTEEESDFGNPGFTDDNKSWLKPVTKKNKGEQFLESDGEEAQSDSEGSVVRGEVQSGSEGSFVGEIQSGSEGTVGEEEALSDSDGSVAGKEGQDSDRSVVEEMWTDSERSVAGDETQSGSEESVEGEEDHQEEMNMDEDENYKVRKLLTHLIFTA